jgi:hypothetical protein
MQVLGGFLNGKLERRGADRRAAAIVAGGQPSGAAVDRRELPDLAVEASLAASRRSRSWNRSASRGR